MGSSVDISDDHIPAITTVSHSFTVCSSILRLVPWPQTEGVAPVWAPEVQHLSRHQRTAVEAQFVAAVWDGPTGHLLFSDWLQCCPDHPQDCCHRSHRWFRAVTWDQVGHGNFGTRALFFWSIDIWQWVSNRKKCCWMLLGVPIYKVSLESAWVVRMAIWYFLLLAHRLTWKLRRIPTSIHSSEIEVDVM